MELADNLFFLVALPIFDISACFFNSLCNFIEAILENMFEVISNLLLPAK